MEKGGDVLSVGKRVSQLRKTHGDTLRQAAQRTGISHTTIARIERGNVTGSYRDTLERIARGYQVPVSFLISEDVPSAAFAAQVRNMPLDQRAVYFFAPASNRVQFAHEFLEQKGALSSRDRLDEADPYLVAERLHQEYGLSLHWFGWGGQDGALEGGFTRLLAELGEAAGTRSAGDLTAVVRSLLPKG